MLKGEAAGLPTMAPLSRTVLDFLVLTSPLAPGLTRPLASTPRWARAGRWQDASYLGSDFPGLLGS